MTRPSSTTPSGPGPRRAPPAPTAPRRATSSGLTLAHNGRPGWEEHYLAAAEIAREDGDVEQELAAMYWLVSCYGLYGPMQKAIEREEEMLAVTEQLGLRRLHHHFLGAYLVHLFGTGTAPDELVGRARRLLVEDPLFRNRAQVDLVLSIGLVDRGDAAGARDVLEAGRRFVRNDEDRSLLCVGAAELAWATADRSALAAALDELATCRRGFFGMNAFAASAAIHLADRRPGRAGDPDLQCLVDAVRRRGRRRAGGVRLVEAGRSRRRDRRLRRRGDAVDRAWLRPLRRPRPAHRRSPGTSGRRHRRRRTAVRGGCGAGRALAAGTDHQGGAGVVPRARPRRPPRRC